MKLFFFFSSLIFFASGSEAQVNFNNITYAGSGCKNGTISITIAPDGESVSVLFDDFKAEIPQFDGQNDNHELPPGHRHRNNLTPSLSHKTCALSFNATIPAGTKADALEVRMQARGFASFDEGVQGHFLSRLIGYNGLANSRDPMIIAKKTFFKRSGPLEEDWNDSPQAIIKLKSACSSISQGRNIRFDLKNHISLEATNGDVQKRGLLIVDSNDMNGFLKLSLKTSSCRQRQTGTEMVSFWNHKPTKNLLSKR